VRDLIYADHAATTALDPEAFEAMKPYLLSEFGNASQPYAFARSARTALKQARETIATCINASPNEIYFTSCGTESDNWVIKRGAYLGGHGKTVVTSAIEHHAILNSCASIEREGYTVSYLPVSRKGTVSLDALQSALMGQVGLVSVMMANNEIGTIQPINKVAELAHQSGALVHTDAVQAVGHVPVDVKALGVDLLSASAHKFNGPKGIGSLYMKEGTRLSSFVDGGAQEGGLRAGTENVASIVAMATALQKNCERMKTATDHLLKLEEIIMSSLHDDPSIDFCRNGDEENHIPGNLSLSFCGLEGETLLHRLDFMNICVSTGSACDSENTQISHVLKAIQADESYAKGTIRISLGYENTELEAERIAQALRRLVHQLKAS
jgi:cysteine desulfurase